MEEDILIEEDINVAKEIYLSRRIYLLRRIHLLPDLVACEYGGFLPPPWLHCLFCPAPLFAWKGDVWAYVHNLALAWRITYYSYAEP